MRTVIAMVCAAIALAGCASHRPPGAGDKPKPSPTVITADLTPVGTVVMVNAEARFVVVSFPTGPVPQAERRLRVYHKGSKVAELKVTGPERDNKTVADILDGQAQVQDEVREE
jgi:hypothetical protein